jgi:spermidine synthase
MQMDELLRTASRLQPLFTDWSFYTAAVPTYVGGIMSFAWASNNPALRETRVEQIRSRWEQLDIPARYYNPALHAAAFALPQYIENALKPIRA